MEQLNRIELKGTVGAVRPISINGATQGLHLRMVTSFLYTNSLREHVVEECWHDVTVWQRENFPDLKQIQKGTRLHIVGRMSQNRYTSADGTERTNMDINAYQVSIIPDGLTVQVNLI